MDNSTTLTPEEQHRLNQPLPKSGGMSPENRQFLEAVMRLIAEGRLNLFNPETLLNMPHYETLAAEVQGHVDLEAQNLLFTIRQMKDLYDLGHSETFEMENLVEQIRTIKERIEHESGDIFII